MQFVLSLLLLIFILQLSSAPCYERRCRYEWPFCRECRGEFYYKFYSMCDYMVIGPGELCFNMCPYGTTERSWNILTGTGNVKIKRCVYEVCPDTKPYYHDYTCVDSCPSDSPYISPDDQCLPNCTHGLKTYIESVETEGNVSTKRCVYVCPDRTPYYYKDFCLDHCPSEAFYDDFKNMCLDSCPTGMHILTETIITALGNETETRRCVSTCPASKTYVYNDTCVESCPSEASYINPMNTCLASCTDETKMLTEVTSTSQGLMIQTRKCVLSCPGSKKFIYEGACVERCPPEASYNGLDNHCLANCTPNRKLFEQTYGMIKMKLCVFVCPDSKPYAYKGSCVRSCPPEAVHTDLSNTCNANCTDGMKKITEKNMTIYDNGTEVERSRCVETCPDSQPYTSAGTCVDICPSFAPFTDTLNNCLANCSDGTKQLTVINKTNSQTNRQCVEVCPDSKPYDLDGACINRCPEEALFISPKRQCVRYCNSIIVTNKRMTKHNERYDERLCVEHCPDFKPYALDVLTCVERCPKDKPYIDSAYSDSRLTCTSKCYSFKDNMKCTSHCPDGTKYVDGDKNCLRVNDCPQGTRFRDTMVYKGSGLVQCLEECNDGYVFFIQTCIVENDCYERNRFVYRGECIEKCPSGFVYFPFPSCASQLALSLVGAFMFAATTTSLIFCRHDVYSFFIHYHLVWQILIRRKDISERDSCSSGGARYTELDLDLESIGEDGTELINSDRMRLLV